MSSITAKPPDFSALCLKIEEARDAMSIAIEARCKPEIVHTFVQAEAGLLGDCSQRLASFA